MPLITQWLPAYIRVNLLVSDSPLVSIWTVDFQPRNLLTSFTLEDVVVDRMSCHCEPRTNALTMTACVCTHAASRPNRVATLLIERRGVDSRPHLVTIDHQSLTDRRLDTENAADLYASSGRLRWSVAGVEYAAALALQSDASVAPNRLSLEPAAFAAIRHSPLYWSTIMHKECRATNPHEAVVQTQFYAISG